MRADPPRVVFVIGGLGSGGSETQLTELLLHAHPHALHAEVVLVSGGSTPRRTRLEAHGVRVWDAGATRGRGVLNAAQTARRVMRQIVRLRPEAIYAWLEESALLSAPAAWALGVPLIVARRNVIGARMERNGVLFGALIMRTAERRGAVVTANSEAGRRFAEGRGIDPARIRVVYNGHRPVPMLPLPADGPFTFGYVARFRPEKGHARLVEAVGRVPADVSLRVLLAGDGPLMDETRRATTMAGLDGRLQFEGAVEDVRAFWSRCHAALLLSDHEGQPNSLIEAALAGRGAIATDVGGSPEVVLPDGGLVVAPDDPAGTAARIQQLASAPELAAQLGKGAYCQATARFSMQRSVDGHLAAIADAIAVS